MVRGEQIGKVAHQTGLAGGSGFLLRHCLGNLHASELRGSLALCVGTLSMAGWRE